MNNSLAALARSLGHEFRNPELLVRALTHRSCGRTHNERLEFLGDAVVNLVIAAALYDRFRDLSEGELTRLRVRLVRAETLAAVARDIGLGAQIRLGAGELKSGGHDRDSILADSLEAVLGAIYEDGGYAVVEQTILMLFRSRLAGIDAHAHTKDAKTCLQEFLQGRSLGLPVYELIAVRGQDHEQEFRVACHVPGLAHPTYGEGTTRRHAEQVAAGVALAQLTADD